MIKTSATTRGPTVYSRFSPILFSAPWTLNLESASSHFPSVPGTVLFPCLFSPASITAAKQPVPYSFTRRIEQGILRIMLSVPRP
jgi:hypothetical protein